MVGGRPLGAAAGLTKLVGGVVLVALLWEYWRGGWWRARRRCWTVPALALVPAGALTFLAYLHLRFGSYRVHFAAQEGWFRGSFFHLHPRRLALPGRLAARAGLPAVNYYYPQANTFPSTGAFMLMDLLLLLAFAAIGLWLCWKVRGSYGLLVLAILGLAAFSGSPQPQPLRADPLPAFIWFALVARRPVPRLRPADRLRHAAGLLHLPLRQRLLGGLTAAEASARRLPPPGPPTAIGPPTRHAGRGPERRPHQPRPRAPRFPPGGGGRPR